MAMTHQPELKPPTGREPDGLGEDTEKACVWGGVVKKQNYLNSSRFLLTPADKERFVAGRGETLKTMRLQSDPGILITRCFPTHTALDKEWLFTVRHRRDVMMRYKAPTVVERSLQSSLARGSKCVKTHSCYWPPTRSKESLIGCVCIPVAA